MDIIKNILAFFFSFEGRISRLRYVIFLFVCFFILIPLINNVISSSLNTLKYDLSIIPHIIIVIFSFVIVILFKYSHLVRRAHDFNKSFYDSGIVSCIAISEVSATIMYFNSAPELALIIFGLISFILMIILGFIKGTDGKNNFGEKPVPFWKKDKSNSNN